MNRSPKRISPLLGVLTALGLFFLGTLLVFVAPRLHSARQSQIAAPRADRLDAGRSNSGPRRPLPVPKLLRAQGAKNATPQLGRPKYYQPHQVGSNGRWTHNPLHHFLGEVPDPTWADPMERHLLNRFAASTMRDLGIPTVTVEEIECRSTMCLLEVSFETSDWEVSKRLTGGADPIDVIVRSSGPLAPLTYRPLPAVGDHVVPQSWFVRVGSNGTYRTTMVLGFDEHYVDAGSYVANIRRLHSFNTRPMPPSR